MFVYRTRHGLLYLVGMRTHFFGVLISKVLDLEQGLFGCALGKSKDQ